jgi:zinc transporter
MLYCRAGLSALTCDSLLDRETQPRHTQTDDGLLVILRGVNCNPGAEPDDMVAIRMLFTEQRIISMRFRFVRAHLREVAERTACFVDDIDSAR